MSFLLRSKQLRFAALFSTLTIFSQSPVLAQTTLSNEKLSQLAEPAVVRVLDGCFGTYRFYNPALQSDVPFFTDNVYDISAGSGFFIHPNGYIATNAHVVDSANESHKSCKESLFEQFLLRLEQSLKFEKGHYSENEDSRKFIEDHSTLEGFQTVNQVILPGGKDFDFEIKSFGTPIDEDTQIRGKDVAVIKIEVQKAPTLTLSGASLPKAASDILILGYPSEAEVDFLDVESSLQMSTIAGSVSAIKSTDDGVKVIQMSASASAGISGGPVLDSSGKVIGLISFGNQDASGASNIPNAITTSTLNEFIGDADGIENQSSRVDALYREGLNYFWSGDYSRAKSSFENVKALFEYHSEVDDLIDEANLALFDSEGNQNEQSFSLPSWLWALIGGCVTLGVAGLGVIVGRRQFSQEPGPQIDSPSQIYPPQESTRVHTSPTTVFRPDNSIRVNGQADTVAGNGTKSSPTSWLELEFNGKIHRLYLSSDQHRLGRDTSWADLEVPNSWSVVSGRHAILHREGMNYRIFDGDGQGNTSSNGLKDSTGELVDTSTGYLLEHGMQLTVGNVANDSVSITFFNPAAAKPKYDPTRVAQ
ncbi:trypsin-like serine protease with C-terminal PDZ domain [Leptolyngbya sp. PCC 7375]|nr:trypsin-like serine protease with C-terminal PDZ domain [Leptolyngbya sp. PCC 7375]